MAGVKGAGGPAPKRGDQRRRANKTAGEERMAGATAAASLPAAAPPADESWHPIVRLWFASLAESGQAVFFQASDWGQAFVLAEAVSRELHPQPLVVGSGKDARVEMASMPMKGATLSAFLKGCTDLLVSETARRRAAVELRRPPAENSEANAEVTDIRSWRESFGA